MEFFNQGQGSFQDVVHDVGHKTIKYMEVAAAIQQSHSGYTTCSSTVITEWPIETSTMCSMCCWYSQLKVILRPPLVSIDQNTNSSLRIYNDDICKMLHLKLCSHLSAEQRLTADTMVMVPQNLIFPPSMNCSPLSYERNLKVVLFTLKCIGNISHTSSRRLTSATIGSNMASILCFSIRL